MRTTITTLVMAIAILASPFLGTSLQAQNVHIPDVHFKSFLLADANINTNSDNEIQLTEAEAYTGELSVPHASFEESITDFTGLEAFKNITKFSFFGYTFSSVEVSNLNLINCLALQEVSIGGSIAGSVNVSNNPALTKLTVSHSDISSLNASNNTALEYISCNDNKDLISIDITNNIALYNLYCTRNEKLTSIDLSTNTALAIATFFDNSFQSLDISNNLALKDLSCIGNEITTLDVSNNTALIHLSCNETPLTSLDVSNNHNLEELICFDTQLTSLNVANGNNENLELVLADRNPHLTCIQHDANFDPLSKPYSDNGTFINYFDDMGWKKDATTEWSTTPCNPESVEDMDIAESSVIFPNPLNFGFV